MLILALLLSTLVGSALSNREAEPEYPAKTPPPLTESLEDSPGSRRDRGRDGNRAHLGPQNNEDAPDVKGEHLEDGAHGDAGEMDADDDAAAHGASINFENLGHLPNLAGEGTPIPIAVGDTGGGNPPRNRSGVNPIDEDNPTPILDGGEIPGLHPQTRRPGRNKDGAISLTAKRLGAIPLKTVQLAKRLVSSAPEEPEYPSGSVPAPKTDLEKIYYRYATACFGMDWRFMKSVSRAESGEKWTKRNTVKRDGKIIESKYVGLFQISSTTCEELGAPLRGFLGGECGVAARKDPELNTAVSAIRFNHYLRRADWSIAKVCGEGVSMKDAATLAYTMHNNGPGVFKFMMTRLKKGDPPRCGEESQIAGVRAFYESKGKPGTAKFYDASTCKPTKKENGEYLYSKVEKQVRGVSPDYGECKWRYGKRRIANTVPAGPIFVPGSKDDALCPIKTKARVFPKSKFPS